MVAAAMTTQQVSSVPFLSFSPVAMTRPSSNTPPLATLNSCFARRRSPDPPPQVTAEWADVSSSQNLMREEQPAPQQSLVQQRVALPPMAIAHPQQPEQQLIPQALSGSDWHKRESSLAQSEAR